MIIYTMKVLFLKCSILLLFSLWNVKNRKGDSMVNIKRKICTEKRINTYSKDLFIALNNHGQHGLLSFLSSLPISVLRNSELEANELYKAALLRRFNIALVLI